MPRISLEAEDSGWLVGWVCSALYLLEHQPCVHDFLQVTRVLRASNTFPGGSDLMMIGRYQPSESDSRFCVASYAGVKNEERHVSPGVHRSRTRTPRLRMRSCGEQLHLAQLFHHSSTQTLGCVCLSTRTNKCFEEIRFLSNQVQRNSHAFFPTYPLYDG